MAVNAKLYGVPCTPAGGVFPGLIASGAGELIVTLKGAEPVPGVGALSVAVAVKAKEPMAVGVPDSEPSALSVRPGGSAPSVTFHVNGGEPPLVTPNVNPE